MAELGFAGIEYMQEMSQVVCYRAQEGEEGRLEDIRDGKTYWVAKLKDGNCWMTQNLDITDKIITSADSDIVSGSFTIPTSDISGFTSSDKSSPKAILPEQGRHSKALPDRNCRSKHSYHL